MNLIIDEGNTRVKLAVFEEGKLIELLISNKNECEINIEILLKKYVFRAIIVSSVTDEIHKLIEKIEVCKKIILSSKTSVPFKNLYNSPNTLGVDRIALATEAYYKFPNENNLIIDVGTCITYDFINKKGEYLGGAIAPGLKMRFKSMEILTQKLPYIELPVEPVRVIGKSTKESMESGVLNGVSFEIQGFINSYIDKYNKVNVILTGGDAILLRKQLKNSIFVDSSFLLKGLNSILEYQNQLK